MAQGKDGGSAMAVGLRCTLAAQSKDGGSAVELALLGLHRGWRRAKLGGGGDTCFACVAWLALVGVWGVLGVVRWQGNWRHYCFENKGGSMGIGRHPTDDKIEVLARVTFRE